MSNKMKLAIGLIALTTVTAPALAANKNTKMKEVTSIVGYNVTETQVPTGQKADIYRKIDKDLNGMVTFKEYRDYSTVENEYDAFVRMDKNGDKGVSYDEFASFNNTGKGTTEFESTLHGKSVKGTNLKTRPLEPAKSYYVPVEPEVVSIKEVETP